MSDLVGWCDEDAFVVPQHVTDHGGPPVSERARFTNDGEVGGVCDTVGVYATGHFAAVKYHGACACSVRQIVPYTEVPVSLVRFSQ